MRSNGCSSPLWPYFSALFLRSMLKPASCWANIWNFGSPKSGKLNEPSGSFFQIKTAHPTTYSCAEGALALWAKNRWWDHPEARRAERISLMRSLASLGMRGRENTPTPQIIDCSAACGSQAAAESKKSSESFGRSHFFSFA